MSEETGWRSTPKDLREAPRSPERRPTGDIPEIYEFGPFRLEPAERKLLCGNEVVALTPKAFDTLHLLVRNSGHLLEKDELIRMLWPDSFVEEGNLTTNIFLLRKALGQGSDYIQTVPKKGYRFVGAVRRLPTAEPVRPDKPRDEESKFAANMSGAHYPTVPLELTHGPPTAEVRLPEATTSSGSKPAVATAVALVAFGALAYVAIEKSWMSKHHASPSTPSAAPANAAAPAFAPPPHSIAVLPFVNLSGDKEQEYFSEGLTEELLNSLSRIDELQVAARTSSFSFQGQHPDIATVAHKLNVGAVLEGSVRRSTNTVRVTAQLVNGVTGFRVWSQTYDRDLGDVLKLQTEIATAVASALKVPLLGDIAAKVELGGTRNPAAFDAYLRATRAHFAANAANEEQSAIASYTEAIHLDPNYALAFAARSAAFSYYAFRFAGPAFRGYLDKARGDAEDAIAIAPQLAEAHAALAQISMLDLNFARADQEFERALALAPSNTRALRAYSEFAALMGRFESAIAVARRAVAQDPLNSHSHLTLGFTLFLARRYDEAAVAYQEVITLNPNGSAGYVGVGLVHYALGNFFGARASCAIHSDRWSWPCLAEAYDKLGRRADAEATLAKYRATIGDSAAYDYAEIYAQWGNTREALEWLATAQRLQVTDLAFLKTDPFMDPLRNEPRFQAIERELKFPE